MYSTILLTMIAIAFVVALVESRRKSGYHETSEFVDAFKPYGDINGYAPGQMSAMSGDIYEDEDEFEGDIYEDDEDSFEGDILEDAIEDAIAEVGDGMSGNIDDEEDDFDIEDSNMDSEGDIIDESTDAYGRPRRRRRRRRPRSSRYRRRPKRDIGTRFPKHFIVKKAALKFRKKHGHKKTASKLVTQKVAIFKTIKGAALASMKITPFVITGGSVDMTPTDLKINGSNLAEALKLWDVQSQGLSRTMSLSSPAGADLTFTFNSPSGQQVTDGLALLVQMNVSDLNKITSAKMRMEITGTTDQGVSYTLPVDHSFTVFKNSSATTLIVHFTTSVKQALYAARVKPTNADPLVIKLIAPPPGTRATVTLQGNDNRVWNDYRKMLSA